MNPDMKPSKLVLAIQGGLFIAALSCFVSFELGITLGDLRIGWWGVAIGPGLGGFLGLSAAQLVRELFRWRVWRGIRHMPLKIWVEPQDDGYVAYAEAVDGSPIVLRLPDDFDPEINGPEYVLELLNAQGR